MMRILALTNLYPNPCAPHRATFNRQQLAALAQEHEVRVIAPIAWTDEWSARRRARVLNAKLPLERQRVSDGMLIDHPRYLFTPKVMRGWYGHFFLRSVRRCFHAAVREARPDVVLGCWAYPDGWAAVRLAGEARLPVVVKVHGSDLLALADQPARAMRTAEMLKAANAIVAVSRNLGDQAIAMGAARARVHVVYNGVDERLFHRGSRILARERLGIQPTMPLILFVGNLVAVKGVDVLIDALASMGARGKRFNCVIVGEGSLRADLQRRAESKGIAPCVRFVGARPLAELADWYRAADLVVLPSRSEGVPNVLLEASACGAPFVATRVGGVPEIASTGSLVAPDDPIALAERMSSFLESPREPSASSAVGTWEDSARAMAAVLRQVTPDSIRVLKRAA